MRIKLNLDTPPAAGRKILIHGQSGAGKTFLLGSLLKAGTLQNEKVYYINTKGEDGTRSIASLGLGEVAETVENMADLKECVKDLAKQKLDRVALDSLKYVWAFAIEAVCGKGKLPVTGGKDNQWSMVHKAAEDVLKDILDLAPVVGVACPSDRSLNQVQDQIQVTPDLPGRMAAGIRGSFDLAGFVEADALGSRIRRQIHFEPMAGVITKLRGREQMRKPIVLTEGTDAWAEIVKALEEVGA